MIGIRYVSWRRWLCLNLESLGGRHNRREEEEEEEGLPHFWVRWVGERTRVGEMEGGIEPTE